MFKAFMTVLILSLALSGVVTAQKPVAQLPRTYIDTTWHSPVGGNTWAVHTSAQLTSALQTAAPGDILMLDAGVIYSGNFLVAAKSNPNQKWIYVTSSNYSRLPTPGVRVSPSDATNMPKIVTPNATNALRFQDGANHWRFVGVEIYSASTYKPTGYTPGVNFGYALIDKYCYPTNSLCHGTSNIPDSIVFDRCYVHGDATHDLQEGIVGNGTNFAVIDSYISDIHGKGLDTQAFVAYVTPGPIKLVNNHFEAAGENVMFGGSGNGEFGFVPSDIEVRNNYLYKPLSWVPLSLNGTYVEKNAFELKSAQRVLFDSNTIENVWQAAQAGAGFLFTVRTSQSGDVAAVTDVTVTNNVFKNVVSGFQTLAADTNCGPPSYPNCHNPGTTGRWYVSNNLVILFDNRAQGGVGSHTGLIVFSPGIDVPDGSLFIGLHDVVVQHNTVVPYGSEPCWSAAYFSVPSGWKPPFPKPLTTNIWILDNVLCRQPSGDWGQQGTSGLTQYMGAPSSAPYDVNGRYYGNVMYVPVGDRVYTFPPHNYATTLSPTYVNTTVGNYQLASPYWTDTSDGQLAGVNFAKLPSSTGSPSTGVLPSTQTSLVGAVTPGKLTPVR